METKKIPACFFNNRRRQYCACAACALWRNAKAKKSWDKMRKMRKDAKERIAARKAKRG